MNKPDGAYGTGVSLLEIRTAMSSSAHMRDTQYVRLMLCAAVEKLNCIEKAVEGPGCVTEVRQILERLEWV